MAAILSTDKHLVVVSNIAHPFQNPGSITDDYVGLSFDCPVSECRMNCPLSEVSLYVHVYTG